MVAPLKNNANKIIFKRSRNIKSRKVPKIKILTYKIKQIISSLLKKTKKKTNKIKSKVKRVIVEN